MLTRRLFLVGSLAAAVHPQKPNLIIILADDMGYGDIGCYGSPDVPTPNIDALAKSGTRFTDGYVSCAVCSPSRVALLTGQYQHRFGHEFNSGTPEREAQINFGLPLSTRKLSPTSAPAGKSGVTKWPSPPGRPASATSPSVASTSTGKSNAPMEAGPSAHIVVLAKLILRPDRAGSTAFGVS